jgi:chromosome segregation ATPase
MTPDVGRTASVIADLLARADKVDTAEAMVDAWRERLNELEEENDTLFKHNRKLLGHLGAVEDHEWQLSQELAKANDTLLRAKRSIGEHEIAKRHAEAEIVFLRQYIEREHGPCVHTDCDTSFCIYGRELRDKWRRAS